MIEKTFVCRYFILLCTFVLVGFLGVVHSVFALTVSPTFAEWEISRGQKAMRSVVLYNELAGPMRITAESASVVPSLLDGLPSVLSGKPPEEIVNWIKIPDPVILASKQSTRVAVVITVPENATPGSYAFALLFTALPTNVQLGNVSLIGKTGPVFIVTVPGSVEKKGELTAFETHSVKSLWKNVYESMPVYTVRARNTGTVTLTPTGSIHVSGWWRGSSVLYAVNVLQRRLLPQWQETFDVSGVTEPAENGFLNEWKGFGFGQYSATLTLVLGEHTAIQTMSFWVIPWKIITMACGSLIILVVGGVMLMRRV